MVFARARVMRQAVAKAYLYSGLDVVFDRGSGSKRQSAGPDMTWRVRASSLQQPMLCKWQLQIILCICPIHTIICNCHLQSFLCNPRMRHRRLPVDYPVKTPGQLRPLLLGFRTAAGLTQAQMAARLGVTQQTYAQLEARPESASMGRLFKALRLLKVQMVLAHPTGAAPAGGKSSRPRAASSPLVTKRVQPGVRQGPVKSRVGTVPPATEAVPEKPARSGSPKPKTPARAVTGGVGSRAKKREDW